MIDQQFLGEQQKVEFGFCSLIQDVVLDFKSKSPENYFSAGCLAGFFNTFKGFQVIGIEKTCLSVCERVISTFRLSVCEFGHKGRDKKG
jgi:hypothetical protein